MTTSTSLSGSFLQPKPPAKGSFPLDHLSECKQFALAYETCLQTNNNITSHCRNQARKYLQCRMDRGLMAQEEWKKLGLNDEKISIDDPKCYAPNPPGQNPEAGGFIAGARTAKRRKERYSRAQGDTVQP